MKLTLFYLFLIFFLRQGRADEDEPCPPLVTSQSDDILFRLPQDSNDNSPKFMLECTSTYKTFPAPDFKWTKNGVPFVWNVSDDKIEHVTDVLSDILIFNRADTSDAGSYQCLASNQYGASRGKPILVKSVNSIQNFTPSVKNITVNVNEPLKLVCDIPGVDDRSQITWYRLKTIDGELMESGVYGDDYKTDPDQNLLFLRVNHGDSLPYICTYSVSLFDKYRFNGSTIYVNVIAPKTKAVYSPAPLYVTPNQVIVSETDIVNLYCIHGGYPKPEITWYVNGTEMKKYIFYDRAYLWRVDIAQAGVYSCHVSNGVGQDLNHSMEVTIKTGLYFVDNQFPLNEPEDGDAEFSCLANTESNPKYEWFINAKPLSDVVLNKRWSVTPNKIVISKVKPSDMSVIGCKVTSGDKTIYDDNYLRVITKAPEVSYKDDTNLTWFAGNTESMNCHWDAGPTPTVQWFKDGKHILINNRSNYTNTKLEIMNITKEDDGVYECRVNNKYGSDTLKRFVTVINPTRFTEEIRKDTNAKVGSTVVFPCKYEIDESVQNVSVVWKFNYAQITEDVDHIHSRVDNSLTITNVKDSDDGLYYCVIDGDLVYNQSEYGKLHVT